MAEGAVDLYWLPLGAGGWFVRRNGRLYERVAAFAARREPCDLYHSALEVRVGGDVFVIEQTPVRDGAGAERGVVGEGAVGARWLGRARTFRYEIRCWRGGAIPDVAEAVDSPQRLSTEEGVAQRVLAALPDVPCLTWGRDELGAGEMWNSNSVIAWALMRGGVDAAAIAAPEGGRAPGWCAGVVAARA